MEASGTFTLVPQPELRPGLMVLPSWDKSFVEETLRTTDASICKECGADKPDSPNGRNAEVKCKNCGATDWTKAVIERS